MENINKAKLIAPMVVLVAAALSMIIMLIREFEFYRMLWTLFIVMIVFYIIGDVAQYLYLKIRPRVIPEADDIERLLSKVDTSKLQLDESLLQQYMDAGNDEALDDLPDSVKKEIEKEKQNQPQDEFLNDYDDEFMDEMQNEYQESNF